MLCDPLTKTGPAGFCDRLRETMSSGTLNLNATVASQMRKMQQQKARLGKILSKDLPIQGAGHSLRPEARVQAKRPGTIESDGDAEA